MASLQLPERCGVMLLPDCTLFPHGGLPLHIFEPRYRTMLEDALEGDCLFAVGRRIAKETGDPAQCTASVGTIGLVRVSREQQDGTSNLLLHGVMRVRFLHWHDTHPYPVATIEPLLSYFEPDTMAAAAIKTLRGAVEEFIHKLPAEIQSGIFELIDRADTPELLADLVSQQFIHNPDLRQQLLETPSVADRIPWICGYLLEAARAEDPDSIE
jgi:Lon protease-like protein